MSLRKTAVGKGVFTTRQLRKGQVIGQMPGALTGEEYDPSYVVEVSTGLWDPAPPFRFLNHSCDANAELFEELLEDGTVELTVVARRALRRGEEVTIDYGWPAEEQSLRCLCGSQRCRGWVVAEEQVAAMRRIDRNLRAELEATRLAPAAE